MRVKLHISLIASLLLTSGCTTYHTAVAKGNVKAIDRLHAEGENVDAPDDSGITPLIHAINVNQKDSFLALLKAGADVNKCDIESLNTPLHSSIIQGNVFFVRVLLQNGADVLIRNKDGKSSLDLLQNSRNEEIKRLVKSNSKIPEVVKKEELKIKEVKKSSTPQDLISSSSVSVSEKKLPAMSEPEARVVLERLMSKHETLAIRTFLNEHPETISLINDPRQQLRYIGPSGWRVMDIAEGLTRGVFKEKEIIEHIETAALPYKYFTEDEIRIVAHYGISVKIINSMISVTH
jgi:hypothetical protein